MKVTRQTPTELVVEDTCLWLAGIFFVVSVPVFYVATLAGKGGSFFAACLFLVLSAICIRKTVFIFDRDHGIVCWKSLRVFKLSSGRIPFSDIIDIGPEATTNSFSAFSHRLTLRTLHGSIPLAYSFGRSSNRNASVREAILSFMHATVHHI
jgi:hypothetical protein